MTSVVQTGLSADYADSGTFAANVTPGNAVVVIGTCYQGGGSGVTFTGGNGGGSTSPTLTYQPPLSGGSTDTVRQVVYVFANVVGGVKTFGFTASVGSLYDCKAYEVSGLGSSPTIDKTVSNTGTSSLDPSAGTTAAITAANELVIGSSVIYGVASASPGGSWTATGDSQDWSWAGYQLPSSAGGTYSWSQTSTTAQNWVASIVTIAPTAAAPSPFTPPARPARGRRAAGKARLKWSPGSPVTTSVPVPSPFKVPAKAVRGRPAARKGRLASSPGSPLTASAPAGYSRILLESGGVLLLESGGAFLTEASGAPPSPFTPPARPARGRPAAGRSRIRWSAPAPVSAPPATPSPFSIPGILKRGKAAARKGRMASSPGSPAVVIPPTPSPFQAPAKAVKGKPAAGRTRLRSSPGSPLVLPSVPVPSPFSPPAALRRAHAAVRKARLASSPGSPVVLAAPSPFTVPSKPARGKPAVRRGRLASSPGSPAVFAPPAPAPFSVPAVLRRGKAAARKARLAFSAGSPLVPPAPIAPAGTWTGSYAIDSGFYFPYPSARPVQIPVTNTAGDWLFAVVAWRPSTAGSGVSIVVADDAHNWWEPVGAPSADSGAAGTVRTALWAAPAARVANSLTGVTIVQVAATGPVLSLAATIVDFSGLEPWYQVAAIDSNYANAVTSLAVSSAAPSAQALLIAAFASDNNSDTVTGPSGWTALASSVASNGVDHTADIKITPAYQVTTASASASVTSSGSLDLAGVIAGVLVSAPQPAQPNPYWPVMVTEAAIGAGVQTPPSEMTWTSLSGRSLAMTIKQGKSYSLGQLQAGQGTITLDDPDGALIPPGTGAFAGIDSGTPLRRRVIWPGLPGGPANPTPNYVTFGGFFRRLPWNLQAQLLRGQAVAEIADIWAYGNGTLNSMAIEECLLDSPYALWPLTDPAGAAGGSNLAPGNPLPLLQVTSKYGAAGATAVFGASSSLLGATSAVTTSSGTSSTSSGLWEQTLAGQSFAQNFYGYALVCADQNYPPISGGVTVETFAAYNGTYTVPGAIAFTVPVGTGPTFTATASIPAGAPVIFSTAVGFTFPTGITAGQVYYVLGDGGTGFQVSASYGGSPVNITVAGAGYVQVQIGWSPVIVSARDGIGPVAELDVRNTDGALLLRYRAAAGSSATTVTAVDTAHDYRAQGLVHVSLAFTQTAWRVLVNGGGLATASGTFTSPLPATFRELDFGGIEDAAEHGYSFPGSLGFAAVYPGFSPQIRVISRFTAASDGMQGEAACDRIERLLEYGVLASRRWLGQQVVAEEGDLCASGQDIGGQASVSSMNNIAASTLPAILYVAPTGDVVYRSKLYVWNEPVKWVLGDDTAAGEIPFAPGQIATDYDPSRVTADVQLTQLDTQSVTTPAGIMSATTMAAIAATAAGQYGGAPYQQTGYLQADWNSAYNAGGSLQDLANWVQAVYARPQNRVQAVTVDAASYPAAWPFWAQAAAGDMVTVNVRLPTAATSPLISLTARITQTDRSSQFSQDGASAKITCTLDFAPEYQALICDDPVRGLLNGQNLLSW